MAVINIKQVIDQIPGDGKWWKSETRNVFVKAFAKLILRGFTKDEAIEFLTDLYWAVANEYGE